jgi:PAS domain S-box-containing protein
MGAEKQKAILLVEDEAITAMAEKSVLQKYGYKVITAQTGEEAVAIVETTPGIDLILMDINLGSGMDGTEAAAIILRKHDMPVVFLSSHMEPEVVEKTEKITSYGYVVKDSSITVLDASIKMAFKLFEAKIREKEKESQKEGAFAALRESEEWNKLILQTVLSGVIVIETATRKIVEVNEMALKLIGLPKEEVVGLDCHRFVCPANKGKCPILDLGQEIDFSEKILLTGAGKQKNIIKKVVPVQLHGIKYLIESFVDITQRKQAEEELKNRNQYIESILDNMPIGFAVNTIDDGVARYLNDNFTEIYGWPKEVLTDVNQFFEKVYPGDYGSELKARVIHDINSGDPEKMAWDDLKITTSKGEHKYISARNIPILKQNLMVSTVWDTTRMHESLEALFESEKKYRLLFDSAGDAIFIHDMEARMLAVNQAACDRLGRTHDELMGMTIDQVDSPAEASQAPQRIAALMERGRLTFETVHQHKDGSLVPTDVSAQRITWNGHPAMMSICRDITERKQAEDALRTSESMQSNALQMTKAGHWEYDVDRDVFTFNDNFYRIFRTTAAAEGGYQMSSGDYARRFCHPEDMALVGTETRAAIESTDPNYSRQIEHRILYADGEDGYIAVRFFIKKDSQGRTVKTYGVNQDISERKRAEKEIKRQLAEKEILLREVHHRIKNNIATIGGLITLNMRSVTDPRAIAVLQDAGGQVDSMRILYDKLLLTDDYKELSVKNYLDDLVDKIIAIFPDHARIKVDMHIDDFHLDPKRLFPLGSIINELLTNIMKYAFAGRKTGVIKIFLSKAGDHVTLTVQDNGIGLPEDFDINESKGFGLMLVKMLSQQLGGSFAMEKRKGTRCTIEFDI